MFWRRALPVCAKNLKLGRDRLHAVLPFAFVVSKREEMP